MPSLSLKTMARNAGKSQEDVERYWREAKKSARKQGVHKKDGEQDYYRYIIGIVKRRLGKAYYANLIQLNIIEARLRTTR